MAEPPVRPDAVTRLASLTPARVALGRVGNALPTRPMLDFQLAHARARDAVHATLDVAALGIPLVAVRSQAPDRATYLARPDLGRCLHPDDVALLPATGADAAIVIADGLSAHAVQSHAAALCRHIVAALPGWTFAPVTLAQQARVAIGDQIGAALGVSLAIVLIGERPGLSATDGIGAYLTWAPRPGRRDSERNCVSNIRPDGLSPLHAAAQIAAIAQAARALGETGVRLKPPGVVPVLPP